MKKILYLITAILLIGLVHAGGTTINITHNLTTTDPSNWVGTSNAGGLSALNNSHIFMGWASGKFGLYKTGDNTTHNLTSTDVNNFIGARTVKGISAYNKTHIYIVGSLAGQSALFGRYSLIDNTTHNLSTSVKLCTDGDDLNVVQAINNTMVLIGGGTGTNQRFCIYNPSTNVTTNRTTIAQRIAKGEYISSLRFSTYDNLVYLGFSTGNFGRINPKSLTVSNYTETLSFSAGNVPIQGLEVYNSTNIIVGGGLTGVADHPLLATFKTSNSSTSLLSYMPFMDEHQRAIYSIKKQRNLIYVSSLYGRYGYLNMDTLTGTKLYTTDISIPDWINQTHIPIIETTTNRTYLLLNSGKIGYYQSYYNQGYSISIRSEETGGLLGGIEGNATLINSLRQYNYTTLTGLIGNYTVTNGNYTVKVTATGYSPRYYLMQITNNTIGTLDAYLSPTTSLTASTIFTIADIDTTVSIPNATVTIESIVNGVWTTIQVAQSDITGKLEFSYNPARAYKFTISASNYASTQFTLNPILYATYNINLKKSITQIDTAQYSGITMYHTPKEFYNKENQTLSIVLSAPLGNMLSYEFNISTGGNLYTYSGANAIGESHTFNFNNTNATFGSKLYLTMSYSTTESPNNQFKFIYIIAGKSAGTMTANKDKTFGLGILERILIVTLLLILLAGGTAYYGGTIPALTVAILIMGFMAYTGFIDKWAVIISMIVGFVILAWRSSQ